ncbi:MAG: S16 family serine protease [Dictyoglomaceae bacterium]|nr:hypothetical protein [Dictyoglomaceae bacterium]
MQIRVIVIILIAILIFEFLSSCFLYFEQGKVLNVRDLFENLPSDFPPNFYIFLLKGERPHFFNLPILLLEKKLVRKKDVSFERISDFYGFSIKKTMLLYGKSDILSLYLAFYAYKERISIPKSLKIGIIGDVSKDGKIIPVLGIDQKVMMAEKEGIKILFIPYQNYETLFDKKIFLIIPLITLDDGIKNLEKFVLPNVGNIY